MTFGQKRGAVEWTGGQSAEVCSCGVVFNGKSQRERERQTLFCFPFKAGIQKCETKANDHESGCSLDEFTLERTSLLLFRVAITTMNQSVRYKQILEAAITLKSPFPRGRHSLEVAIPLKSPFPWGRHFLEVAIPLRPPFPWSRHSLEVAIPLRPPFPWSRHFLEVPIPLKSPFPWGPHSLEVAISTYTFSVCFVYYME